MKVTSVSFVWNRAKRMVKLHLFSVANQSCDEPSERFLVDFSTNDTCKKDNKALCEEFGFIHIHHPIELWCKSLGMNIGIKRAKHPYIASIDIDQVIHQDFFEYVLRHLGENTWIGCQSWMTPPEFMKIAGKNPFKHWEQIMTLCREKGNFNLAGDPIHILPRKWFYKVRGFNEDCLKWGIMDNEMMTRIKWANLRRVRTPKNMTFHQYHKPPQKPSWLHNRRVYDKVCKKKQIIANLNRPWGDVKSFLARNYGDAK